MGDYLGWKTGVLFAGKTKEVKVNIKKEWLFGNIRNIIRFGAFIHRCDFLNDVKHI